MNAATTIRDLVMSERLLPGRLAHVVMTRDATRNAIQLACFDLHVSGAVHAEGPRGALIIPDESDLREYGGPRKPHDISGHDQQQRALFLILEALEARLPGYRYAVRNGAIIVRWRS